tara:strand:- start:162 stop:560 length:399 start_codon:yes stop_codon:yes gene_type:complete
MAWVAYLTSGMMTTYLEYSPDVTLETLQGMYSDDTFLQVPSGTNPETHYILDGEVTEKTELSATWSAETVTANGSAEIVLATLPIPCTVYIDGEAVVVEDGSLEFSTEAIGEYGIRVNEAAYLEKEWTINAV